MIGEDDPPLLFGAHLVEAYLYDVGSDRLLKIGAELGVSIGRKIGCGSVGCVWSTDRPGVVVKVTASKMETQTWQWLMEEQEKDPAALRGIPRIGRVLWLESPDPAFPGAVFGVVMREDIASDAPWDRRLWHLLSSYESAAEDFNSFYNQASSMRKMLDATSELAEMPGAALLAETLRWLAEHGHAPIDIHRENVGSRDGDLVLRDPGAVRAAQTVEIYDSMVANPCCDMLTANATEHYYVWTVKPRGENPVEGWGPYTNLANTKIHARIKAQKGKHDVTVTTDPRKDGFRVIRRYAQGTGETKQRG